MIVRSFLFVPGDSERKLARADACGADALVIDLEDSVHADRKPAARQMVQEFLRQDARPGQAQRWVRINPLDGPLCTADLLAVVGPGLAGVLVPKCAGQEQLSVLDRHLDLLEERSGMTPGTVRTLPVATEIPAAMFELGSYRHASSRLYGLTWGAEDLAAGLGATTNRDEDGDYDFVFQLARTQCLLGAKAAGVQAVDTVFTDLRDLDGLAAEIRRNRRRGFTGKAAVHPDQVAVINTWLTPDVAEVAQAQRIVDAFRVSEGHGVLQLDGRMLDQPHLTQARQVLALARELADRRRS